jgi:hypothetical protein
MYSRRVRRTSLRATHALQPGLSRFVPALRSPPPSNQTGKSMHSPLISRCPPAVALGFVGLLAASLAAAAAPAPTGPACTPSAWSGTVSYQRIQSISNSKAVPRVTGRGEDRTEFQMSYEYKALVAVTESADGHGSVGKATVSQTSSSTETTIAKEMNSCDRGKSWQEMTAPSSMKPPRREREATSRMSRSA